MRRIINLVDYDNIRVRFSGGIIDAFKSASKLFEQMLEQNRIEWQQIGAVENAIWDKILGGVVSQMVI